jgi:hypothetical protein
MFQICVPNQKVQGKKSVMFLNFFLNTMIRNIKIHNILYISKSMEIDKCIQFIFYENVLLNVSYDFSKFDGSRKIKV